MDMLKNFVYVLFILTIFGSFVFWVGLCGYETITESGLTHKKISIILWVIPVVSVVIYNKVVVLFNKTEQNSKDEPSVSSDKSKKQIKKTSCKKCGGK